MFFSSYSKIKIVVFCTLLTMCLLIGISGNTAALEAGGTLAEIEDVHGKVLLKRFDAPLWEQAENGAVLLSGDIVKSRAGSSAIIKFSGSDYFKLMPLSMCQLDQIVEESGMRSNVISLKEGKVWTQSSQADSSERMIVEAGGAILDVTAASMFIETIESGSKACVDVFNGTANLRGSMTPDSVSVLEPNKRALVENGVTPEMPESFASSFNMGNESYSCMVEEVQVGEVIKKIDNEGILIIVTSASVTFSEAPPQFIIADYIKEENTIKMVSETQDEVIIIVTSNIAFTGEEGSGSVLPEFTEDQKVVSDSGDEVVVKVMATVDFAVKAQQPVEEISGVGFSSTAPAIPSDTEAQEDETTTDSTVPVEEEFIITGTVSVTFQDPEVVPDTTETATPVSATEATPSTDTTQTTDTISSDDTIPTTDISSTSDTSSTSDAADSECTTLPNISAVSVNAAGVADGGTAVVEGGECETEKKVDISWSVTPLCGATVSNSIKIADDEKTLSNVLKNKTQTFTEALTLVDEQPVLVSITVDDDSGNTSEYSITVQLNLHSSLSEPPVITSVSYSGSSLSEGDTADVVIDTCDAGTFSISGTAFSKCWGVTSVVLTQDGEALSVSGTTEWSADHGVASSEGSSVFSVKAIDDAGNESDAFSFNISYSVDETLLAAPTFEEVFYGEESVGSGDTVYLPFDSCEPAVRTISGTITTPCGGPITVSLKKNNNEQSVSGGAEWTAEDEMSVTDEPAEFSLISTNASGKESEEFSFTVETQNDVYPPESVLETVSSTTVEDLYSPMTMYVNNLDSGSLVLNGSAESEGCEISYVEVSVDDGGDWKQAEGTNGWTYSFTPSEDTYYITTRVVNAAGMVSDQTPSLELIFRQTTDEDDLRAVFDRLIAAYQDKDTSAFSDIVSVDFSTNYEGIEDSLQLDSSLNNKFNANPSIYLRVSVDSVNVIEDSGSVAFRWTSSTSSASYEFYALFEFVKDEAQEWKLSSVQDDDTFLRYTSVAAKIVLTALDSDLIADEVDSTTLIAEVRDSAGNLIGDGTVVTFSTTSGTVTSSSETFNGEAEAEYVSGSFVGDVTIIARSGGVVSNAVTIELHPETAPLPPGMRY